MAAGAYRGMDCRNASTANGVGFVTLGMKGYATCRMAHLVERHAGIAGIEHAGSERPGSVR